MGGVWWDVEVEVHRFLVGFEDELSCLGVDGYCHVEEDDGVLEAVGCPF